MKIEFYKELFVLSPDINRLEDLNKENLEDFYKIKINSDKKIEVVIINKIESLYKDKLYYKVNQPGQLFFYFIFIKDIDKINVIGVSYDYNNKQYIIDRDKIMEDRYHLNMFSIYSHHIFNEKLKRKYERGSFISKIFTEFQFNNKIY